MPYGFFAGPTRVPRSTKLIRPHLTAGVMEPPFTFTIKMPQLTWSTKSIPSCPPAKIKLESIIYPNGEGYPNGGIENHLYWGDNLRIMSGLMDDYEGKIDLIYADPPFFTNKEFI